MYNSNRLGLNKTRHHELRAILATLNPHRKFVCCNHCHKHDKY